MKVALVQTPQWQRKFPPLGVALLSAALRKAGFEVEVFDINNTLYHEVKKDYKGLWDIPKAQLWTQKDFVLKFIEDNKKEISKWAGKILASKAKVIGFSTHYSSLLMSLELARLIKAADVERVIIIGGPECLPGRAGNRAIENENIDAVVLGEAEETLPELIRIIEKNGKPGFLKGILFKKNKKVIDCGPRPAIKNINRLAFADFSDFQLGRYLNSNVLPVYIGRGCPYKCVFCTVDSIWKNFRSLKADRLFKELEHQLKLYKNVDTLYFCDSIINGNIKELIRFCDLILKYKTKNRRFKNLSWSGEAALCGAMTKEMLIKMKLAGCGSLSFGIESGSQKVLKDMRKPFTIKTAERLIRDVSEAGIVMIGGFIVGFPTESKKDFEQTLKFLKRNAGYLYIADPSETFCSIDEGTYLSGHSQEFNVPSGSHMLFWSTFDGKNDYPERAKRFKRFVQTAGLLGIRLGNSGRSGSYFKTVNSKA
ncbi:MAG: B12-binding domain-containing radical SAM protein [Elusimicrobia bacterium]|nr:B12-binding domain-containing radical SAM protein [Candidatus Liberimonas magnetica]